MIEKIALIRTALKIRIKNTIDGARLLLETKNYESFHGLFRIILEAYIKYRWLKQIEKDKKEKLFAEYILVESCQKLQTYQNIKNYIKENRIQDKLAEKINKLQLEVTKNNITESFKFLFPNSTVKSIEGMCKEVLRKPKKSLKSKVSLRALCRYIDQQEKSDPVKSTEYGLYLYAYNYLSSLSHSTLDNITTNLPLSITEQESLDKVLSMIANETDQNK